MVVILGVKYVGQIARDAGPDKHDDVDSLHCFRRNHYVEWAWVELNFNCFKLIRTGLHCVEMAAGMVRALA